jgi:hypothetical protein
MWFMVLPPPSLLSDDPCFPRPTLLPPCSASNSLSATQTAAPKSWCLARPKSMTSKMTWSSLILLAHASLYLVEPFRVDFQVAEFQNDPLHQPNHHQERNFELPVYNDLAKQVASPSHIFGDQITYKLSATLSTSQSATHHKPSQSCSTRALQTYRFLTRRHQAAPQIHVPSPLSTPQLRRHLWTSIFRTMPPSD